MPRAKKLVNLDVEETSGVDKAAHLHDGFLVMKNASDANRVKSQLLQALGKSKEDNLSNQEQIDLEVAKAVGEYEEKVASLEAALMAAQAQAADLAVKLEEIASMQSGEPVEAGYNMDKEEMMELKWQCTKCQKTCRSQFVLCQKSRQKFLPRLLRHSETK